ncbi:MAG: hypothetical protein ACRCS3_13610 [Paracoccaceae bacterium]
MAKLKLVASAVFLAITIVLLSGLLILSMLSQAFPPVFLGKKWATVQDNALRVVESKYGAGAIQMVTLDDGQEGAYRLSRRMTVPAAGERICVAVEKHRFQAVLRMQRLNDAQCGRDPKP